MQTIIRKIEVTHLHPRNFHIYPYSVSTKITKKQRVQCKPKWVNFELEHAPKHKKRWSFVHALQLATCAETHAKDQEEISRLKQVSGLHRNVFGWPQGGFNERYGCRH